MAQAKTLTKQELKRLLDVTRGGSRYVERDVTMLLLTHWCGLRVGEVAALRITDVVDESWCSQIRNSSGSSDDKVQTSTAYLRTQNHAAAVETLCIRALPD